MCLQNKKTKKYSSNKDDFFLKNIILAIFTAWLGSFSFISVVGAKRISKNDIQTVIIDNRNYKIESKIKELAGGYPIEKMARYISQRDKKTAIFLMAIAKKESNWGKRKPILNGKDCYNYWGFRAKREKMGSGGHTCFDNPKDAVNTVAKRIDELINVYNRKTPAEMIVWKCGSNCAVTGGQSAANKWIKDVSFYYDKFDF